MTAEAPRPRRRPGENRQRLLEAGMIEFGLHGFHGASTAVIAARAGVPQPHLYASFASKQELLLACVEMAVNSAVDAAPAAPSEDALRVLYQAYAAAGDPELNEPLAASLRSLSTSLDPNLLALHLRRAAESLLAM